MSTKAKVAKSDVEAQIAWVCYCDVYGFKAMLLSSPDKRDIARKLKRSFATINKSKDSGTTILGLSDCFFLIVPCEVGDPIGSYMVACTEFVKALDAFADEKLFLRGGAAYGEVLTDRRSILLGDAIVRAVGYETLMPCPIVTMPAREILRATVALHKVKHKRLQDVQTKDGIMAAVILTPSVESRFRRSVIENYELHRVAGPDRVAGAWALAAQTLRSIKETN